MVPDPQENSACPGSPHPAIRNNAIGVESGCIWGQEPTAVKVESNPAERTEMQLGFPTGRPITQHDGSLPRRRHFELTNRTRVVANNSHRRPKPRLHPP